MQKFIDQSKYAIESSSLTGEGANKVELIVDLNEPVLVEQVIIGMQAQVADANIKEALVKEFLMPNFIVGNFYREHHLKNYEEKIFFFEPINKYYDLLWMKRIAFNAICAQ